jgi:FRG domain
LTWALALNEWTRFLDEIDQARFDLNCTWSNAWFRGNRDADYPLLPSLLRPEYPWIDIPSAERPQKPSAKVDASFASVTTQRKRIRQEMRDIRDDSQKENQLVALRRKYRRLEKEEKLLKANVNPEYDYRPLIRIGERDAFIKYQYKLGTDARNSWQVLAEMQHHGVPTRLLDWTDILANAVYFALTKFTNAIDKYWFNQRMNNKRIGIDLIFPPGDIVETIPEAAVWVLNPYFLARYSSSRNRIWDLTLDPRLDYYNRFIEDKSWPFDLPIPAYTPWRGARIAAQSGMFVVWGYNRDPLDFTLKLTRRKSNRQILRKIKINKMAAIYGVKHLRQFSKIDRFSMFRDRDALGSSVREEFFH